MRVNSDFDEIVALNTDQIDWVPSPMQGVDRRMLDRIGDELARATSIVRYAPGSHFSAHTHSGGEEFIVLEGVFQDEHGDYPAGTYVRDPIGSRHIPRSEQGCTIFVKLWQFESEDQHQFSVDLDKVEMIADSKNPNVSQAILHRFGPEVVSIEEWTAGSRQMINVGGGAEILILDGTIKFEGREFDRHDWIRLPASSSAQMSAGQDGVRIWIKTGHLENVNVPVG